jgi:hypothetical protein
VAWGGSVLRSFLCCNRFSLIRKGSPDLINIKLGDLGMRMAHDRQTHRAGHAMDFSLLKSGEDKDQNDDNEECAEADIHERLLQGGT